MAPLWHRFWQFWLAYGTKRGFNITLFVWTLFWFFKKGVTCYTLIANVKVAISATFLARFLAFFVNRGFIFCQNPFYTWNCFSVAHYHQNKGSHAPLCFENVKIQFLAPLWHHFWTYWALFLQKKTSKMNFTLIW